MVSLSPLPRLPSLRLDGKRALVTGAGRGIGLAAAAGLAQSGAHVVLAARTLAEVEAAAEQIRAEGGSAEAMRMDVTDTAATNAAIAEQPAFHILVNNAGTNRPRPFLEVTEDDYDAISTLNQRAAFFAAQAVARLQDANAQTRAALLQVHGSANAGQAGTDDQDIKLFHAASIGGCSGSIWVRERHSGLGAVRCGVTE